MLTRSAARSIPDSRGDALDTVQRGYALDTVLSPADLRRSDWTPGEIRSQLAAHRWQRIGRGVVLHNGPLTTQERQLIALLNCGPRAVLTAFTAASELGLTGWERAPIDVLVPAGARIRRPPG
ncbi:MAG: hypothetical protein ABI301_04040, partial [Jatrophihabitantaceae bacterium]